MEDKPRLKISPQDRYQEWLKQLTPAARVQLNGQAKLIVETEEDFDFQRYRNSLSPQAQAAIDAIPRAEADFPVNRKPQYCASIYVNGEWGRQEVAPTALELAQKLSLVVGTDVVVHTYYGLPLPITKKTAHYPRMMMLPEPNTAIELEGNFSHIEDVDMEVEIQVDGFLGPPELSMLSEPKDNGPVGEITVEDPEEDPEIDEVDAEET